MVSKKEKIIGFDLDGVIIDHTDLKLKLAAERGYNLKPEQTGSDAFKNFVPKPIREQIQHFLYSDEEALLFSQLMPGAKSVLGRIKHRELPYFLISRRKDIDLATRLLRFHGLWPEYFNGKNAFFVDEPEDKNNKAREIGVTHYVDDELGVLEKLADVEKRFLFDPFDVVKERNFFTLVHSWSELADFILS